MKHTATMELIRWRALYIKTELAIPRNRAESSWLQSAAGQLHALAEVVVRPGALLEYKAFPVPNQQVELPVTSFALAGIKCAVVQALLGTNGRSPVPQVEGADLLEACRAFGEKFLALVVKEAKLPEAEGEEPLKAALGDLAEGD